jgi:integrase
VPQRRKVRGARWSEIELALCEWTVAADRMKMKRALVVPLSDAAIGVLGHAQPIR